MITEELLQQTEATKARFEAREPERAGNGGEPQDRRGGGG